MSWMKGVPSGAAGNKKLLSKYGGNTGTGPNARQCYATGGAVMGKATGGPAMGEGMEASGSPAKPSLARPGRKMPGKGGKDKKGTTVNIVIAGGKGAPDAGSMPAGPMAGPPMIPPHPAGPPMLPPGAGPGGPPLPPMHKFGGKVGRFARGGKVKRESGGSVSPKGEETSYRKGDSAEGRSGSTESKRLSENIQVDSKGEGGGSKGSTRTPANALGFGYSGDKPSELSMTAPWAAAGPGDGGKRAHGGKVNKKTSSEEEADKSMKDDKARYAKGGSVPRGMTAGMGSELGREERREIQMKGKR